MDAPAPAPVDPRLFQDAAARPAPHVKTLEEVEAADRQSVSAIVSALSVDGFMAAVPKMDPEGNFSFPGLPEATDLAGGSKELANLFGAFSGRTFALGRTWQAPSTVVVEWTMTGIQSGEWLGVKPSQKPVALRGLALFWFDPNGLVSDTHLYFDVGAVLAELGAAPKGVEAPLPLAPAALAHDLVTAQGSDAEKQNLALVDKSWDAFEAKNEAGYLAPIADDIEVFRLDRANVERGKAERKKFFKWAATGIGGLAQNPLNAWGIGAFVVEEYTLTGVNSGKLTDAPPSGHALRLHYVDVDELRDGKIVRTWTYGNSLELYAETRVVKLAAPGATPDVIE